MAAEELRSKSFRDGRPRPWRRLRGQAIVIGCSDGRIGACNHGQDRYCSWVDPVRRRWSGKRRDSAMSERNQRDPGIGVAARRMARAAPQRATPTRSYHPLRWGAGGSGEPSAGSDVAGERGRGVDVELRKLVDAADLDGVPLRGNIGLAYSRASGWNEDMFGVLRSEYAIVRSASSDTED